MQRGWPCSVHAVSQARLRCARCRVQSSLTPLGTIGVGQNKERAPAGRWCGSLMPDTDWRLFHLLDVAADEPLRVASYSERMKIEQAQWPVPFDPRHRVTIHKDSFPHSRTSVILCPSTRDFSHPTAGRPRGRARALGSRVPSRLRRLGPAGFDPWRNPSHHIGRRVGGATVDF